MTPRAGRWLHGEVEERRLERLVEVETTRSFVSPAQAGLIAMTTFMMMSGCLRRDGLVEGVARQVERDESPQPERCGERCEWLCAALRGVSAVGFWTTVDEMSSAEMFVGVENCDWSAWR